MGMPTWFACLDDPALVVKHSIERRIYLHPLRARLFHQQLSGLRWPFWS
jgi:hypothetical protein